MMHPQMIQELLVNSSFNENQISKEILVPCLQKMSISRNYIFHEVKFIGGSNEFGNDIEYYEIIGPDKNRIYTGIQVKKGNIDLPTATKLITQGTQALSKGINDLSTGHKHYLGRWIIAFTGEITEQVKTHIKDTLGENARKINISFWPGSILSEFILDYFYDDFIQIMNVEKKYMDSQNVMMHIYDPENPIVLLDKFLNLANSEKILLKDVVPQQNVDVIFLAFYPETNSKPQGISIKTNNDQITISPLMSQVSLIPIKISNGEDFFEIKLTQFSEKIKVVIRGFRFHR